MTNVQAKNSTMKKQLNLNSMKTFKSLTLGAIALFCVASVNAQTDVYITGSTAFRSAATVAIRNIFDAAPAVQVAFSNNATTPTGANQVIYVGNIGGNAYNIHTSWSGSEAGIQTVAGAPTFNVNFLPNSTCPGSCSNYPGTSVAAGSDAHVPQVAFSDTFQATSQFRSGVTLGGATYTGLTEASGTSAGHGSPVGVVVFKWCADNGATISNITSQQVRSLYTNGRRPLALFTGLNADEGKIVVALGRNPDSGTRLTALAETGIGALGNIQQFQPQTSASVLVNNIAQTVSKFVVWPAETINNVPVATFRSGYSSGGDLSKAMRAVTTNPVAVTVGTVTGNYATGTLTRIAYLGASDADANLLNAGSPPPGVELSYNGAHLGVFADYGTATVITEGQYTFWSFEHVLYNSSTIPAAVKTAADTLATQIHDTDAPVLLSEMRATRTADGANVTNSGYSTVP
jgi:hypothetical protein